MLVSLGTAGPAGQGADGSYHYLEVPKDTDPFTVDFEGTYVAKLAVGITDGIDPIPQFTATVKVKIITEGADPIPQISHSVVSITEGADPVPQVELAVTVGVIEDSDPVPTIGISMIIVDDPDPSG